MKIIDAHVHFQPDSKPLVNTAQHRSNINFSAAGLKESMRKNDVSHLVLIGLKDIGTGVYTVMDKAASNPLMPAMPKSIETIVTLIAGINPHMPVGETENAIKSREIKGFKVWLGYYHFAATDKEYYPFYELASKYGLPVIFHTGDTYSKVARVRYSQPLTIDDVAVDFPDLKLIIAHIGNPNTMDAAQVLYKNENVFADLSGLIIGGRGEFKTNEAKKAQKRLQDCFDFVGNPQKFMFGSDWPLAGHSDYIDFIKAAIPEEHYEDVFYNNAKRVFGFV